MVFGLLESITRVFPGIGKPASAARQLAPPSVVFNTPRLVPAYTVPLFTGSTASAWALPPKGPMLVHVFGAARSPFATIPMSISDAARFIILLRIWLVWIFD